MKVKLSAKARSLIRRQMTLARGGNGLGGVTKTPRHRPPRAISLAPVRCLQRDDEKR